MADIIDEYDTIDPVFEKSVLGPKRGIRYIKIPIIKSLIALQKHDFDMFDHTKRSFTRNLVIPGTNLRLPPLSKFMKESTDLDILEEGTPRYYADPIDYYNDKMAKSIVHHFQKTLGINVVISRSMLSDKASYVTVMKKKDIQKARMSKDNDLLDFSRSMFDGSDNDDKVPVLVIDVKCISEQYYDPKNFNPANLVQTIMHEYGHIKTLHKITMNDCIDARFVDALIDIMSDIMCTIYPGLLMSPELIAARSYLYLKYEKPEILANEYSHIDYRSMVKAVSGIIPNGTLQGHNLDPIGTTDRSHLVKLWSSHSPDLPEEFMKHVKTVMTRVLGPKSDKLDYSIEQSIQLMRLEHLPRAYEGLIKEGGINMEDRVNEMGDIESIKKYNPNVKYESCDEVVFESSMVADNTPPYNTDMSESQAKRTLGTLTEDIVNHPDKEVSQYTASIYSNIITKNLLPVWAKGYRKFNVIVDPKQKAGIVEFKIPAMTQDFVSRFIEGRESINGFLHRNQDIRIRMSPSVFKTMKNRDDAFNFFRAAIKYYDAGITKYAERLMHELMKLPRDMKHLISSSSLSGLVTLPMQMFFVFDDVSMDSTDVFKITSKDLQVVTSFIKGIYSKYAAPEKEKKQIINDLNSVITSLRESCEFDENVSSILSLPTNLDKYYMGEYKSISDKIQNEFISENTDWEWMHDKSNSQLNYIKESFGVKKLKKIPRDIVAYITIETESIEDANDKMMIASYCLSKLEIVEWYIELLEVGSKKYIVPHSKPYLEALRTQLLACYKNIMNVKIVNPNNRPLIDIKYPDAYAG